MPAAQGNILPSAGHGAVGVQGDVSDAADVERLYQSIRQDHGRLDVVFANAGVSESSALGDIDEAHLDRVWATNVKGTVFTVQQALPLMRSGGSVILAGSVAGSLGFGGLSVYGATKAAIRSFARTWTTDLKSRGIRGNVVSPGMVEMTRPRLPAPCCSWPRRTSAMRDYLGRHEGAGDMFKQMIPFGRLGAASFIASHEFFVDGV